MFSLTGPPSFFSCLTLMQISSVLLHLLLLFCRHLSGCLYHLYVNVPIDINIMAVTHKLKCLIFFFFTIPSKLNIAIYFRHIYIMYIEIAYAHFFFSLFAQHVRGLHYITAFQYHYQYKKRYKCIYCSLSDN